jgi:hypothetical protein
MPHRPVVSLAALAVVAVGAGCATPTFTHRCDVPQPVVEAAPGPRIPLAVTVRHSTARGFPEERSAVRMGHEWTVEPLPPSRAMLERLAASAFERVVLEPEGAATVAPPGADAILDVRIGTVSYAWGGAFDPYHARVVYRVALRDADGGAISEFDVDGVGTRNPFTWGTHCVGIGDAVAIAMQDAGAKVRAGLRQDSALDAWLAARPAFSAAVDASPDDRDLAPRRPAAGPAPQPGAPDTPSAPLPVTSPPPVRRAAHASARFGSFLPEETSGVLEGATAGWSLDVDLEMRFSPWLALAAEVGYALGSWTNATTGAGTKGHLDVGSWTMGGGLRGFLPGAVIEPWMSALVCAVRPEVNGSDPTASRRGDAWLPWEYFSFPAASAGLELGAGLRIYPARSVVLGVEVRRLFARGRLDPYPGGVELGGWTLALSLGFVRPP